MELVVRKVEPSDRAGLDDGWLLVRRARRAEAVHVVGEPTVDVLQTFAYKALNRKE